MSPPGTMAQAYEGNPFLIGMNDIARSRLPRLPQEHCIVGTVGRRRHTYRLVHLPTAVLCALRKPSRSLRIEGTSSNDPVASVKLT